MSVYVHHIYHDILFDRNLESLLPFQFVTFHGSSLQLACHCLSAYRIDSVNLLRDDIALSFAIFIKEEVTSSLSTTL